MLTKTLYYVCYFFSLLAIFFGILTYDRWQLPYDDKGRYFDPIDSIVYHIQEAELYTFISIVSLVLAVLCFLFAYIRSR